MKIRKPCNLAGMYAGTHHPIAADAPEMRFMNAVCAGMADEAAALFRDKKLFGAAPPVVDAPYGRFEGLEGIRAFASGWLKTFNASHAFLTPVVQTISGGRSALEAVINFVVDGEVEQVPMFIVADYRTPHLLDEVRLYCHFSFVPNLTPYRRPMFKSAHREMGDPNLLTGAVREYYEALHHVPAVDVERIMKVFAEGCLFGGYERWGEPAHQAADRAALREKFERMSEYIPRCVGMRFETVIDDGRTCVIEWVHVVSRAGQEERLRVALSGIAAYERNEEGLLIGVRISDYAHNERDIDWTKTPLTKEEAYSINFVETFPAGVGERPQS